MTTIELGRDFDISSSKKCSTSEGVYLAIKSGKFDGKLETVLRLLHKKENLLSIKNLNSFKKILFGKIEVSEEDKFKIRTLLKLTLIGEEKPIINKKFGVLVSEVIDNLLFKDNSVSDFSKIISDKVSSKLFFNSSDNVSNLNPKLHGYSDIELLSYSLSDYGLEHIKNLGALDELRSRLEKNPKVLKYFLNNEVGAKKVWAILYNLFFVDENNLGDLSLNNRSSFENEIISILIHINPKSAGIIINNSDEIYKSSLILEYIKRADSSRINIDFFKEIDLKTGLINFLDINKTLELLKNYGISSEKIICVYSYLFLEGLSIQEKLKNLKVIYDYKLNDYNNEQKIEYICNKIDMSDIFAYLSTNKPPRNYFNFKPSSNYQNLVNYFNSIKK